MIDLRSDTVTKPTPAMREAMYRAEVGDDVWGEDPTVQKLEQTAAERLGKEAALYVVSGVMGNLVALLTHCGRGDEFIVGDQAHTYYYEGGGSAALGGIHARPLPTQPDGTLEPARVEGAVRPVDIHFPPTRLICLENTHNRAGGRVLRPAYMAQIRQIADRHGLPVHLDGARVFNAAVALGVDVRDVVRDADTVMFCLSKGLCAPVGSLVCGSREFIARARVHRKMVGGGTRQVGVLAAAGLVALETMVDRLAEDHANARRLAEAIADMPGVETNPADVETNILMMRVSHPRLTAGSLAERMKPKGVLFYAIDPERIRLVTHHGVTAEDVETVLQRMAEVLTEA
ncbi:MAG: low-specificity L-threonine aldolase [Chloroflexi bacterium]|nr:low-specificity L-threonine aldolase [Chloroflexota bacterium]